ncbi:VP4 [Kummerowia striata gokushovirus]|nr:VP4 [Kummerowia striata gokushovirus]
MCTSPRTASFNLDGSINFSKKKHNRELVPFKLPCGKCVECLLERARDWAVRCTHEASTHESSAFLTLTYAPEHEPPNGLLQYADFQKFMKRLRRFLGNQEIGFFMCGEYGEKTQRPHYHACIFGYDFTDKEKVRENHNGDEIWNSKKLTELWGLGHTELGSVTPQSAGYVARYVLKKQDPTAPQGFQRMSRTHAIGKRYVEKWWKDLFIHARGAVILSDGSRAKIPRYYEKWLRENQTEAWLCYITTTKLENTDRLQRKAELEHSIFLEERDKRGLSAFSYKSPLARKREILHVKQKQLKRSFL